MKKRSFILFATVFAVFSSIFTTTAGAISLYFDPDTFSYSKVLPLIVGISLVIEALVVLLLSKVRKIVNVSFAVFVANAASFVAVRLFLGLLRQKLFYSGMLMSENTMSNWIMLGVCLVISAAIEIPIIYFLLKRFTPKIQWVALSAVVANILSFIATAACDLLIQHFLLK